MQNVLNVLKKIGNFIVDILLRVVYVFRDLGVSIWHGLIGLKNLFVKFGKRFAEGSIWTKISHFIMGFGNFARKQFVKGALFLLLEVVFIVFMVSSPVVSNNTPMGGKAIANFFTLGEYHGLPYDQSFDFDSQYIKLESKFEEQDIASYEQMIYRISNVLDVIKTSNENVKFYENISSAPTGDAKKYYSSNNYNGMIYDNRFDTNDYYGYYKANLGEDLNDLSISTETLIWITSKTQIDQEVKNCIQTNKNTASGVYVQKLEDGFRYLIILKAKGKVNTISFSEISSDVEVIKVGYEAKYVELGRDFSFLMLLYGIITFAMIALFIVAYNLSIASSVKADNDIKEGKKPTTFIEDLKTLLDSRFHLTLLTPAIILLVVFTVVPTIMMILIAFTDLDKGGATSGQLLINWTGFTNFAELFSGSSSNIAKEVGKNFGDVLLWTFEWALIATFSCYFGGIFLALLINKKEVKGKKAWRTIFILTIAIPQFITLLVLRNLLSVDGPLNTMLVEDLKLITEPINFLQFGSTTETAVVNGNVWLARITVLVINLYIGIPYTMLMTSGILMNIPKDLYEAATIDGANKWQMFRKITLPYVIFVTTPYLISSFIGNITSFNTIFLTTNGGPSKGVDSVAGHTDLLVTWLYKLTMEDSKFNAGSIIGILTFVITAFITLVCYRNSKAYKEEDTFQ